MSIRFAPTGWCQIEEVPRCSLQGDRCPFALGLVLLAVILVAAVVVGSLALLSSASALAKVISSSVIIVVVVVAALTGIVLAALTATSLLLGFRRLYNLLLLVQHCTVSTLDHNLWDVIVNGDLEEETTPSGEQSAPPAKQLAAKRNQERVKSILLLAIPDEYLLNFHNVPDAKSPWATIKSRFGGNEESKKMQKNVLKHQFENFTTASNKNLDKAYDRFQKLISQLEVHGAPVSKEDINQKFLRSLPPSWSQIALIMRNKPDIDQVDIDDLYNNLRVYEDEMKSTNEVSPASGNFRVNTAGGSSSSNQIDQDDLEELDIRQHVAMLTVRVQRFVKKTGRNLDFKGKQPVTFDKSKVECHNCQRKWHFAKECKSGRNQGKRTNDDNGRRNATTNEPSSQALVAQDGLRGYDWSNDFDEPVNYALMAISSSSLSSSSGNEVRSSDEETTPANDKFSKADRYHVVPPPITGNFLTLRADISFVGLDEYAIRKKIIKSKTTKLNTDTSKSKTNETVDDEDDVFEVNTVSPVKTNEIQTVKTQVDKIGQTSQKEGIGFKKIKACFVCLVNYVRPNGKRAVHTVSTARPRYYYTRPVVRPKDLKQDVKTSGVKNMTTVGTRAVVNTGKGKMDNAPKKSMWVWRLKGNYMDHESKEKGSFILKKFEYGNPEICLQDHAVLDSGCSSHITGNKAYLSDYEDYNGGFVAFGSDPKGGKITGKGKIKTAYLDFDDVYFVDELKFNLFSVSQMCDKKNSVLFTDIECRILSPSFKLLDENQVVLRAPKQNDMYSLDLKNIVPSGGITCLYANATIDEFKLWHRRLGHVNFKNINKLVKGHLVRGLPSKVFVNDHTCVACKKGKQHKASCKLPSISFIRPFGCPLTILNTLDPLGKFDGKSNEGYLLGYSTTSKAFGVYNKRTKRGEENMHIDFLEDQPNVAGSGTQEHYVAGSSDKDKEPTQEYILLPLHPHRPRILVEDVVQATQINLLIIFLKTMMYRI
ncbi:ribonuclease H-like domain-containing protein [Tanacetum coccineum]